MLGYTMQMFVRSSAIGFGYIPSVFFFYFYIKFYFIYFVLRVFLKICSNIDIEEELFGI